MEAFLLTWVQDSNLIASPNALDDRHAADEDLLQRTFDDEPTHVYVPPNQSLQQHFPMTVSDLETMILAFGVLEELEVVGLLVVQVLRVEAVVHLNTFQHDVILVRSGGSWGVTKSYAVPLIPHAELHVGPQLPDELGSCAAPSL